MPDKRTDKQGFSTMKPDEERDMAAKGGPTTSLGNADDAHDVPHPYDEDTQTQLAAKSTKKKKSGETMNDDWKTGTDKNMNPDAEATHSSINYKDSPGMGNDSNYKDKKQTTSNIGSINSKTSNDVDDE